MVRKSKEYLSKLKKKHNTDTIWSWSRFNSYKTDPYGYMLKYIRHEKETKNSIYGVSGGNCHDIVEKFYKKEIAYADMMTEYENKLFEMNMAELKYNRNDESKNDTTADKYEGCIRLFFQNHIPIIGNVVTEQFITVKVGNNLFQGYIDFVFKDSEDCYNIIDWKTSSIYSGKKIDKEKGQLVLYAESLVQKGIPIEKIKIKWNFLKYCNIEYQMKGIDKETQLHKTKITKECRDKWVVKISNNLKMWLKESGFDELETEDMIQTAISNNNLDNIPEDIKNKYIVTDCYVEIPLNEDVINELKSNITTTIGEIKQKEFDYTTYIDNGEIEKAEELFWTEIDKTNEFFFAILCGYSVKQHKPYKEYLDTLSLFVDNNKDNETDDNWLNDL